MAKKWERLPRKGFLRACLDGGASRAGRVSMGASRRLSALGFWKGLQGRRAAPLPPVGGCYAVTSKGAEASGKRRQSQGRGHTPPPCRPRQRKTPGIFCARGFFGLLAIARCGFRLTRGAFRPFHTRGPIV
jgi:hypothetical protein